MKTAEADSEAAIARANEAARSSIERLRTEGDAAYKAAAAAADAARTSAMGTATAEAQREAAAIRTAADNEAARIAGGSDRLTPAQRKEILAAVLGEFLSE